MKISSVLALALAVTGIACVRITALAQAPEAQVTPFPVSTIIPTIAPLPGNGGPAPIVTPATAGPTVTAAPSPAPT